MTRLSEKTLSKIQDFVRIDDPNYAADQLMWLFIYAMHSHTVGDMEGDQRQKFATKIRNIIDLLRSLPTSREWHEDKYYNKD